uniref:Uncharacterized protein n=1 Tax=Anguilla anguilla TaxID=7936 RepID=A0A0E9QYD0_ANGAN
MCFYLLQISGTAVLFFFSLCNTAVMGHEISSHE